MRSLKLIIISLFFFATCASNWQSIIVIGEKEKKKALKKLMSENKKYKIYILDDGFYEIKYKDK